jgi:hypothetical protein
MHLVGPKSHARQATDQRQKSGHRRLQGAEIRRGNLPDPLQGLVRDIGQTPDLEKIRNRIWFTLRHGSHRCATLQTAWNRHGQESLTLEACERLEDEETLYIRDALLKERMLHWRSVLGAEAI